MTRPKPSLVALTLALVYFIWPIDLIPDIFGPLGRVDDLAIFALIAWQAYTFRRSERSKASKPSDLGASQRRSPYAVFDLPENASKEEIEARYRELVQQYHPDKVNHLGEDLKKLAHEKMLEITTAYSELVKHKAS